MEMSGAGQGFLSRKNTLGLARSLVSVKVFVALPSVMPEVTGSQKIGGVSEVVWGGRLISGRSGEELALVGDNAGHSGFVAPSG